MSLKPMLAVGVAIAALVVAGCGSSKKSSSSTSSSSAATSTPTTTTPKGAKKGAKGAVPSRTYHVKLTGSAEVPKGAPKGVGDAIVTIHGSTLQACWRFSHLHGFTGPTFAHIHQGAAGSSGNVVVPLSTGPKLLHKGCVSASATVLGAIVKNPRGYYVNIHSTKYPGGAVRSQL